MLLVHLVIDKDRDWARELPQRPAALRVLCYASMILLIVSLGASDAAPFIYLQF